MNCFPVTGRADPTFQFCKRSLRMTLPGTLRRACLLAAAILLTASIGATPLYAVDAGKTDADKAAAKTLKKKVAKETKPKPQAEVPPSGATGFSPNGY
jgi:hypothetical protein